jgi:hypothetical protein
LQPIKTQNLLYVARAAHKNIGNKRASITVELDRLKQSLDVRGKTWFDSNEGDLAVAPIRNDTISCIAFLR